MDNVCKGIYYLAHPCLCWLRNGLSLGLERTSHQDLQKWGKGTEDKDATVFVTYIHAPVSDVGTHRSWYLHLLKPVQIADRDVDSFLIQEPETWPLVSPGFMIKAVVGHRSMHCPEEYIFAIFRPHNRSAVGGKDLHFMGGNPRL